MNAKVTILRTFLIFIATLFLSINVVAQNSEKVVILWDVTGSLLSPKPSKGLGGQPLPAYSEGNGMWVDLQKAVIDCIDYVETDPGNEILLVTFNDNIRDIYTRKATEEGKKELIDLVRHYPYKGHKYTNIIAPLNKFYSALRSNSINYMFLFTDGAHEGPGTWSQFISALNSWSSRTSGNNAYGFYVLVHPSAENADIRRSVEAQDNFWIVPNAKVRIKICTLPSSIKYNVRDEKGPKTIRLCGKCANASGDVDLIASDEYYEINCSSKDIKDGMVDIEVKVKDGVTPPVNHSVNLTPVLCGADPFTFVGPNKITLDVCNKPERSLNLTIANNKLGKATYYDSCMWLSASSTPIESDIFVKFSEQAAKENSSAVMKVYFVDKKSEAKVSPSSAGFTLCLNGKETESIKLTPDMTNVKLIITGGPDSNSDTYYGRIELSPSLLDNYDINGSNDIYKWSFKFTQKTNPLKLSIIWIVIILVSAFLLWMIVLKPLFYPRFRSIQKTFMVPGMPPLIVKFKGVRQVVISSVQQKQQSGWNRFWTGRILYKIHPAFVTPMTLSPVRGGKCVLVSSQGGVYRANPNPMPGIGIAQIAEIQRNVNISVN